MTAMRAVVVGAGVGGLVIAAQLSQVANTLLLCPPTRASSATRCAAINASGIEIQGAMRRQVAPAQVRATLDPDDVESPDLLLVVGASTALERFAALVGPGLSEHSAVVVVPGRTGGALEFSRALREMGRKVFAVAETSTLPFTGRLRGPNTGFVAGVKRRVTLGAIPAGAASEVASRAAPISAEITLAANILQTSFSNVGVTMHVAGALLNAPAIERGVLDVYYRDGVTPAVARVMEAVDEERRRVAAAFGCAVASAREYVDAAYGSISATLYEAIHSNPAYDKIGGLEDLHHRYLSEDLPASAVPLSGLAALARVPTPVLDALLEIGEHVADEPYRETGRDLRRMGLEGMSTEAVVRAVSTGTFQDSAVSLDGSGT